MERAVITVPEFAEAVAMSRSGAYAAIAQGRVPCIRIGPRTVRVPVEALQEWLRTNTRGVEKRDDIAVKGQVSPTDVEGNPPSTTC